MRPNNVHVPDIPSEPLFELAQGSPQCVPLGLSNLDAPGTFLDTPVIADKADVPVQTTTQGGASLVDTSTHNTARVSSEHTVIADVPASPGSVTFVADSLPSPPCLVPADDVSDVDEDELSLHWVASGTAASEAVKSKTSGPRDVARSADASKLWRLIVTSSDDADSGCSATSDPSQAAHGALVDLRALQMLSNLARWVLRMHTLVAVNHSLATTNLARERGICDDQCELEGTAHETVMPFITDFQDALRRTLPLAETVSSAIEALALPIVACPVCNSTEADDDAQVDALWLPTLMPSAGHCDDTAASVALSELLRPGCERAWLHPSVGLRPPSAASLQTVLRVVEAPLRPNAWRCRSGHAISMDVRSDMFAQSGITGTQELLAISSAVASFNASVVPSICGALVQSQ